MATVFLGGGGCPEAMLEAGRQMAFRDGVDPKAMENLLRKVGRTAQFRAFSGFMTGAANEDDSG